MPTKIRRWLSNRDWVDQFQGRAPDYRHSAKIALVSQAAPNGKSNEHALPSATLKGRYRLGLQNLLLVPATSGRWTPAKLGEIRKPQSGLWHSLILEYEQQTTPVECKKIRDMIILRTNALFPYQRFLEQGQYSHLRWIGKNLMRRNDGVAKITRQDLRFFRTSLLDFLWTVFISLTISSPRITMGSNSLQSRPTWKRPSLYDLESTILICPAKMNKNLKNRWMSSSFAHVALITRLSSESGWTKPL